MSGALSTTKPAERMGRPVIRVMGFNSRTALLGEQHRMILGLTLGEIDQDIVDLFLLLAQIHTADHVGQVFLLRERFGFRVGGLLRKRIDGCTACCRSAAPCRRGLQ